MVESKYQVDDFVQTFMNYMNKKYQTRMSG